MHASDEQGGREGPDGAWGSTEPAQGLWCRPSLPWSQTSQSRKSSGGVRAQCPVTKKGHSCGWQESGGPLAHVLLRAAAPLWKSPPARLLPGILAAVFMGVLSPGPPLPLGLPSMVLFCLILVCLHLSPEALATPVAAAHCQGHHQAAQPGLGVVGADAPLSCGGGESHGSRPWPFREKPFMPSSRPLWGCPPAERTSTSLQSSWGPSLATPSPRLLPGSSR